MMIDNLGCVVSPIIATYIRENTTTSHGYFWVMMYFVALNIIALLLSIFIHFIDKKYYKSILYNPYKEEPPIAEQLE